MCLKKHNHTAFQHYFSTNLIIRYKLNKQCSVFLCVRWRHFRFLFFACLGFYSIHVMDKIFHNTAFKKFINYSQTSLTLKSNLLNVGKIFIIGKTNIGPRWKNALWQDQKWHKNYTKKLEMQPVTSVVSLCKLYAVGLILCSNIARYSWNRS